VCFTGIDLVITVAGVLAYVIGFARVSDATVRSLVAIAQASSPVLFAAVALRGAYLTGALETKRDRSAPVTYTREHIVKMNEVAQGVRERVQWFGMTDYYSNTAPTGTQDLVKALDSHFNDLHLAEWNAEAQELDHARKAISERIKELGDLGRLEWLFEEFADRGAAATLLWTLEDVRGTKWLTLTNANIGRFLDVTGMDASQIEDYKSNVQDQANKIASSKEAEHIREIRNHMTQPRARLLPRLSELTHVDALPAGSRCDLCDPRA